MPSRTPRPDLLLWIGGISSFFTLAAIAQYPLGRPILGDYVSFPNLLVWALQGALLGGFLGLGHSILLERHFPVRRWRLVAYTSVGMAAGWSLWSVTSAVFWPILRAHFDALAPPVNAISGALMAGALSISQAYALGRQGRFWSLMVGIGWFAAWISCVRLQVALFPDLSSPPWSPVVGLAFGLIYSSTTAIPIFMRVRRHVKRAA